MTGLTEETNVVNFGNGLYSADLPSSIPDGFCSVCTNLVPTGTSLENRFGFRKSEVNYNNKNTTNFPLKPVFTYLKPSGNEQAPIMIWGEPGSNQIYLIREGDATTVGTGNLTDDGYISADFGSTPLGAVNYNGTIYVSTLTDIKKITNINWNTNTITTSALPNTPNDLETGPIHFKDRIWAAGGNKLYYTDPPSSPGGLPETWDPTGNFFAIVGSNGPGKIFKIIPLDTRLFIFTSQGLYALTVIGPDSEWYLRPIDEDAIVNTFECAFENSGLLFYVSIQGVFVTNGTDPIKLSGPIQNFFLAGNFGVAPSIETKRTNQYRIHYLDGGMIVSISNFFLYEAAPDVFEPRYNTEFCFNFYTRLDTIAWSLWEYRDPRVPPSGNVDHELVAFLGVADSVETYINKTPLTYAMILHAGNQLGNRPVMELVVYDGLQDQWTLAVSETGPTTADVSSLVRTRYFGDTHVLDFKAGKYAFLELFLSELTSYTDPNTWAYYWNLDYKTATITKSIPTGAVGNLGEEFALVKLDMDFHYRRAQFELLLRSENKTYYKIKSLYVKEDTRRDVTESVS